MASCADKFEVRQLSVMFPGMDSAAANSLAQRSFGLWPAMKEIRFLVVHDQMRPSLDETCTGTRMFFHVTQSKYKREWQLLFSRLRTEPQDWHKNTKKLCHDKLWSHQKYIPFELKMERILRDSFQARQFENSDHRNVAEVSENYSSMINRETRTSAETGGSYLQDQSETASESVLHVHGESTGQAFERTSCEQNLESASNENREYHSHVICSSSNSEPIIDSLMFGDNPRFEASQTSSVGQVRCSGSEPNSSGSISDFPAFNSSPAICRNASASFSAITEEHNHALQSESESESSVISQDQDQRGQSIQYSEQNAIILRELSAASTAEDTGAVIPCPGALNSIEPPRYWTLSMSASPLKLVDVSNEMLPCIQNVMDETCKREHIGQRYRGAAPKSIGRCHKGFSVVNVRYIENPELWQRYAHERKMIGERYQEGPVHHYGLTLPVILEPLCREANEVFLFHGTHGDNVDDIIRHGFDPRVGADDNLMGNGIYFAENSSKSDEYCIADTKGICRMFVARVALGEKYEAARLLPSVRRPPRSTDQPSKQYDSVVGITTEARPDAALEVYKQYVVYDGRQIYPEFLVEYKRVDADGDELEDEISSWRDAGQANANSFSGPAPAVFAAATRRVSELRGTSATKVRDDRVGELQASVKALVEDMQILKSFVLSKGEERRETTDVQTSPLPLQCAESPSASLRGLSEGSRGVAGGRRERAGRGRARSSSRPLRRTSRSLSADGRRYSDRERRNGHRRRSERDERRRDRTRGRDRSRSRVPSHPRRSERSNSRSYARSRSRDGSRWRVEKNSSSRGRRRCSREGSRHHQERSRSRVERSSSRGQGSSSRGRRSGCHEGRSSSWGRRSGCHEGRSSSRGRGGGRGRIRGGSKERRHDRRRRHGGERSRDDSR